jgi:hypothetical protein
VASQEETFHFTREHRIDTLAVVPIVTDSWTLFDENGKSIDSIHIHLDPISGEIRWTDTSMSTHQMVNIRYKALLDTSLLMVGPAWRHLPSLEVLMSDSASSRPSIRPPDGTFNPTFIADESFVASGSLFRGLTLATGSGANLSGGLNLQLQGNLGENIFLQGSLTDQNLPILPEGDTRTINELDQVKLTLTGPRSRIEAGDFVLRGRAGRLSSFQRKLEGMHFLLYGDNWEAEGALAGSPGKYRSQTIQGEDGRQGPYALTTEEGSHRLIILPGTEVVWLNGRRLERGESLDYTIDYSLGEIRFPPRHTIRVDSRIVVDFEYTDLVYNRTSSYLSAAWQVGESDLNLTAFTERDNLKSNLDFSLTAEDRRYLKTVGDSVQDAEVSTAAPDSAGDYALVNDRYVWRGQGQGDHRVAFHSVGSSGQYRRIVVGDSIIYRWVPPDEISDYNTLFGPFRVLQLPRQHDLITASWQLGDVQAGRIGRAELGISQVDLNRYSSLDDQDNLDMGYSMRFQWRTKPFTQANRSLKAGVQLDAQGKGSHFQPLGRWDAVEFVREWDLDENPDRYRWQTGTAFLEEAGERRVFAQWGQIQADSVQANRLRYGFAIDSDSPLTGRFNETILSRDADQRSWRITDSELRYNFKWLTPYLGYYGENRKGSVGGHYDVEQLKVGLQAQLSPRTQVALSRERRRDIFQAQGNETARLWLLSFSRAVPRGTRLETTFSFNEKHTTDDREDLSYMMGNLSLVHRVVGQPWWMDLRYRLERSIVESKAVVYDSIGAGRGQYRYDPVYDIYVPDEAGPFVRYTIPAGKLHPINTVKSRFQFQMDLNRLRVRLGPLSSFVLARLLLQGLLTAETEKHSLGAYLKPSVADTAYGRVQSRFQMDLSFQSRTNRPQYRLRFFRLGKLNRERYEVTDINHLLGETQEQSTLELIRISRHKIAQRTMNLEYQLISERRVVQSQASSLRNHDIQKWQGRSTIAGNIGDHLTASLTGRLLQELNQELDDLSVRTVSVGLGLQRKVGKTGRLRLNYEWFQVDTDREVPVPYLMAEGFPTGKSQRFRANSQINLSRNLLLSITAFSRQEAGRAPFSMANLELRTQF